MQNQRRTICWLMWVCFLLPFSQGPSVNGQSPDPNGWGSAPNDTALTHLDSDREADKSTRQPVNDTGHPLLPIEPGLPNDVRAQIGLATYEEATQPTHESKTVPPGFSGLFDNGSPVGRRNASNHSTKSNLDANSLDGLFSGQTQDLTSPEGIQSSIKIALLLATLSLAPAIVLMTTCYIRVIVVLTLLKQAFGGQQLPPTQVLTALSLFLTFLVMAPVWSEVKTEAIDPYSREENPISWEEAWERGVQPIRQFMIRQIEVADNAESIEVFYRHLPEQEQTPPSELSDVPLKILFPAFIVSELKVAFLLGFQVFLPFLVLDLVVSSVTVSMGMLMIPPNMISFPLKLILFVMVDGWNLVIGMLLQSFG